MRPKSPCRLLARSHMQIDRRRASSNLARACHDASNRTSVRLRTRLRTRIRVLYMNSITHGPRALCNVQVLTQLRGYACVHSCLLRDATLRVCADAQLLYECTQALAARGGKDFRDALYIYNTMNVYAHTYM